MAKDLGFDLIYGVGKEEIFELSYTTFAEELQLQEILKESMAAFELAKSDEPSSSSSSSPLPSQTSSTPEAISSPSSHLSLEDLEMEQLERAFNFKSTLKEQEDAVAEDWEKCACPVCHRFSCTECTMPQGSRLGNCNIEQQKKNSWDEKGRENFRAMRPTRHSRSKFNGRGTIPKTRSKDIYLHKQWGTLEHPIPLKGSKLIFRGKSVKANEIHHNVVDEDDYDTLDDEDDDSDTSQKSHEIRKKSKWFKEFFERVDALNGEEMDETVWHCPACQGGPGAIKWYRSIHDLIAHSKKIGAKRVKLHRQLAKLLEEELSRKGTSIAPEAAQIIVGNWKGLKEDAGDHDIVWPPMVVILNTMTSIYKDGKFVGMGSHELLEHFSSYPALKAKHSYGSQGHRGLSVLIFESSAVGYLEAERLHKTFVQQGLDRFAWNSCRDVMLAGGERQLYGFMAEKEDMDIFNQHFQGKSKIKYELKSYEEAVLNEMKKMREDSVQLMWLKERLGEERKHVKTLEESVQSLSRNLQLKLNDIRIFEQRVQLLHQQNKEEMDCEESFYKAQIRILEAKVKELEKLQESNANANANPLQLHREETTESAVANLNMDED